MLKWLSIFSIFLSLCAGAQQAKQIESEPLNKTYQQVLYAYYQGDFLQALTQLAILEQKFPDGLTQVSASLAENQTEPELLKGGISLSYGLDNQAEAIFSRLLSRNADPEIQSFAWLLLGKTYFQNRQFENATNAFAQIVPQNAEEYFDQAVFDNWVYMQARLEGVLSEQNANINETDWLVQLSSDSIYRQYLGYNQALAMLQKGQTSQGIKQLTNLAEQQNNFVQLWVGWAAPLFNTKELVKPDAERETIRDRANLTLGYTLLQNNEPHQAYRAFEQIRTDGLDAEPALLGFGWAAAKKDDLQTALSIWQSLMQLPQNTEYVLEAYLASAYAYEQAFAPRQSLAVLTQAIQRFEQSLMELDQASQRVRQRQFILDLMPGSEQTTDTFQQEMSQHGLPVNASQVFASVMVNNEFRTGLVALEQSAQIQQQLQTWQQQMRQYHLMLDERQQERVKRAQQIEQNSTFEQLSLLQQRRSQLAAQLDSAISQQNGQIFMPQQSQDWLERVKKAQLRINNITQLHRQLNKAPLSASYQKRLSRVKGRLIWQANEALAANQWQAQKALAQLDADMQQAKARQQQLLALLGTKPNYAQQRAKVSELAERIYDQIAKNEALQAQLIAQLSATFEQFIQAHKVKVQNYLMQAQLAIVRLNDQALSKESGPVPSVDSSSVPAVNNSGDQG